MSHTGLLYVLANRDGSLAKVGFTRTGTPELRATDYERQHGIVWRVYWTVRAHDVADVEARVHHDLQFCRFALTPDAREIFHCTPAKAVHIAERYVSALPGTDSTTQLAGRPSAFGPALAALAAALFTAAIGVLRTHPRSPPAVRAVATAWPTLRRFGQLLLFRIGR